jgi:hypothetical protein
MPRAIRQPYSLPREKNKSSARMFHKTPACQMFGGASLQHASSMWGG